MNWRPRYLTEKEVEAMRAAIARARGEAPPTPKPLTRDNVLPYLYRQRGFSLIEICIAMAVAAIMLCLAAPSFVHTNNQAFLQSAANSFRWTYMQTPTLPRDPTWSVSGNTWSKAFDRPAGTLSITTPTTTGGSFRCAFPDSSYRVRC